MTRQLSPTETDLLQARLASRLAAGLGERAEMIPADVTARLRFAREQALERARGARQPGAVNVARGGAAVLANRMPWWLRVAALVPLLLLVAGLFGVEQLSLREQVLAAAEIDALLLADDIPPDAYRDPGFVEFLKTPAPSASSDAL